MYFDVFVNGTKVATVGPSELEHLSISVAGYKGSFSLDANGLSAAEPGQLYLTWLQNELGPGDVVSIAPSNELAASEPTRTRKLRRGQKASKQNLFCDFCKQTESEDNPVVQAGDTPFICLHCAELCVDIAKNRIAEASQANGNPAA